MLTPSSQTSRWLKSRRRRHTRMSFNVLTFFWMLFSALVLIPQVFPRSGLTYFFASLHLSFPYRMLSMASIQDSIPRWWTALLVPISPHLPDNWRIRWMSVSTKIKLTTYWFARKDPYLLLYPSTIVNNIPFHLQSCSDLSDQILLLPHI